MEPGGAEEMIFNPLAHRERVRVRALHNMCPNLTTLFFPNRTIAHIIWIGHG